MKKEKTADEVYFILKKALQEVNATDEFIHRAIEKTCGKKYGIGISEEGINTLKKEYRHYKTDRDIESFLKKVFEITRNEGIFNEKYDDIKVVAELREEIAREDIQLTKRVSKLAQRKTQESKIQESKEEKTGSNKTAEQQVPDDIIYREWIGMLSKYEGGKKKEQKPVERKITPIINYNSTQLQTDSQKDEIIKRLCINGLTLREISINGIPTSLLEDRNAPPILSAILNVIRKRIQSIIEANSNDNTYDGNISKVLAWIIESRPDSWNEIHNKERNVLTVNANAPKRFFRIMDDCFKNGNGDLDYGVMVFILERLKRINFDLTKNNEQYTSYKHKAESQIEWMIKEMIKKERTFSK